MSEGGREEGKRRGFLPSLGREGRTRRHVKEEDGGGEREEGERRQRGKGGNRG